MLHRHVIAGTAEGKGAVHFAGRNGRWSGDVRAVITARRIIGDRSVRLVQRPPRDHPGLGRVGARIPLAKLRARERDRIRATTAKRDRG